MTFTRQIVHRKNTMGAGARGSVILHLPVFGFGYFHAGDGMITRWQWPTLSRIIVSLSGGKELVEKRHLSNKRPEMKNLFYILGALAVVAALHYAGLLDKTNLTHPFWRRNATLFGSLTGAFLAGGMFWVGWHKPRLGRAIGVVFGGIFLIALPITLYAAKVFIDSADFERLAGNIWHKGAYTVFAAGVVWLASLFAAVKKLGKQVDQ